MFGYRMTFSWICRKGTVRFYCSDVRVRFAPSPTGYLHLGGLRTALYNFLFAKKHKGKFILRIEDTDQSRLIPGAANQLEKDLNWCNIKVDESPLKGGKYGPYVQSQRVNIYKEHIKKLLYNQTAYYCFCSDKRLQLLKREALKVQEIPKYDNKCRHLTPQQVKDRLVKGEPYCIRFKLTDGVEEYNDIVYGKIAYNVALNEGDPVVMKSDGFPTYHFANVVDDHLMGISHVLRGVEWQISTTKHLMLYRAFGWKPPEFGHLPLLLNADGSKLSKRQGDIQISHYRDSSIFPLALLNFIVHSGGGFQKDTLRNEKIKCHSLEELAEQFDVFSINNHSGKLMPERLGHFNRLELKRKLENRLEEIQLIIEVQHMLKSKFPEKVVDNSLQFDSEHVRSILHWSVNRIEKLTDLLEDNLKFIWVKPSQITLSEEDKQIVRLLKESLNRAESFEKDFLTSLLKSFSKENNVQFGQFMKLIRSVCSGLKEGPSVAEILSILGKKNVLQRLDLSVKNK